MKKNLLLSFLLMFGLWSQSLAQDEDVLFQAFDWEVQNQPPGQTWYNVLQANLGTISDIGVGIIWMPPPSNSGDDNGYLPRELYDLNSNYGTRVQLEGVLSTAHALKMKVLGDAVLNHRVGSPDAVTFLNPAWPTTYICKDDEGPANGATFSDNFDYFPGTELKANPNENGTYEAARDIDHEQSVVRQSIKEYLNFLKSVGFDGWRYDFVHGYNPAYNKEYNDATEPYFAVAELLESSRVQLNNWLNKNQRSASIFDFNTKVSLQNAIRDNNFSYLRDNDGNASGLIGWQPAKSVTFLDNHDTGPRQVCCGIDYIFPGDETSLRKGYAYILTHPGNPMVFWAHYFDQGDKVKAAIKEMVAIRKDVRVYAGSKLSIAEARNDLYAAYIDGRNGTIAMKLGQGSWEPFGDGWGLKTFGTDYAIWTKGTGPIAGTTYSVYFKKPSTNWASDVNIYLFNTLTNTELSGTATWPGQQAERLGGSSWYKYLVTVPQGTNTNNVGIVYNDGGVNQTVDLSRGEGGWFEVIGFSNGKATGNWSGTCPSECPDNGNNYSLYFDKPSSWANVNIYLFNSATNSKLEGTADWPGQATVVEGSSNWYSYNITVPPGVNVSDIGMVYNDGNGQQTVDLFRATEGWFNVTGSLDDKVTGSWSANCTNGCPTNIRSSSSESFENGLNKVEVIASPNPFSGLLNITVNGKDIGSIAISVVDLAGKEVYRYQGDMQPEVSMSFDSKLPSGVYLLKVNMNNETVLVKRIVRK